MNRILIRAEFDHGNHRSVEYALETKGELTASSRS